MKKGGLFIGSVPNSFRMRNRWKFLLGEEFDKDPTHVRLFSYEKIERMLSSRFKEIEIVPIQGKIAPFIPSTLACPISLRVSLRKTFFGKQGNRLFSISERGSKALGKSVLRSHQEKVHLSFQCFKSRDFQDSLIVNIRDGESGLALSLTLFRSRIQPEYRPILKDRDPIGPAMGGEE